MKFIAKRFAYALLMLFFTTSVASAKVTSRVVSIGQDFSVGGTTIKAGTYRFSFDSKTNELSVVDKRTKAVVAKTIAHVVPRAKNASFGLDIQMTAQSAGSALAGIAFPGDKSIVMVGGAGNSSAPSVTAAVQ